MVTIKIKGGFGNQLFQYALGKYLSEELNTNVKYDITYFDVNHKIDTPRELSLHKIISKFNLKVATANENGKLNFPAFLNKSSFGEYIDYLNLIANRRFNKSYYLQTDNKLDYTKLIKYKYLDGFWQSNDFVVKILDQLIADFDKGYLTRLNSYFSHYQILPSDVCIHIRRGDYVSKPSASANHGICSLDYYTEGIKYYSESIDQPRFFFFSDDINWVKHTFSQNGCNNTFIDLDTELKDLAEFFMMTKFQHFIIANSTYSWWAAILSKSRSVIAPEKWFVNAGNELALTSWKLI